jgi:hypothetical protein
VFDRFTDRARQVVVLAQEDARDLRHNYIGTEHILLALLREQDGLAAQVLEAFGITIQPVRTQVIRIVGTGDEAVTGEIPFTKHAKNALERTRREAMSLGNDFIGTEHILIAVARERESRAAEILGEFDAGAEKIRGEIIRITGGPGPRPTDEGFPPGEAAIKTGLRRVIPVATQMSDGLWVVSVEVWDHGLIFRWAAWGPGPGQPTHTDGHGWHISDDVGTTYVGHGGLGFGGPQRGHHYAGEFEPAPPPEATSLLIRRDPTGEELSICLTD